MNSNPSDRPGAHATAPTAPESSCLLGFDYGRQRIGVAVGQRVTGSATPLTTLHARDAKPDWEAIARLIAEWQPAALVVGEPCCLDGSEHELTAAARRFSRQLEGRFGLPVHLMDERLSSKEAERIARDARAAGRRRRVVKEDIDKLAAQIILQSWLDQQETSHDRHH